MSATAADPIETYPELAPLTELRARGWRFVQLHDEAGQPCAVVGSCAREGYNDMLWITGRDETRAARVQTTTRGELGEIVWAREGSLAETVQGLLELPAPDECPAGQLPIRRL